MQEQTSHPVQLQLPIASRRAERPRPVALPPSVLQTDAEQAEYLSQRQGLEQRSVLRGLLLLAATALVVSFLQAGVDRAFYASWWRQW